MPYLWIEIVLLHEGREMPETKTSISNKDQNLIQHTTLAICAAGGTYSTRANVYAEFPAGTLPLTATATYDSGPVTYFC